MSNAGNWMLGEYSSAIYLKPQILLLHSGRIRHCPQHFAMVLASPLKLYSEDDIRGIADWQLVRQFLSHTVQICLKHPHGGGIKEFWNGILYADNLQVCCSLLPSSKELVGTFEHYTSLTISYMK